MIILKTFSPILRFFMYLTSFHKKWLEGMPEKVLTGTVKSIKESPDETQSFFSRAGGKK